MLRTQGETSNLWMQAAGTGGGVKAPYFSFQASLGAQGLHTSTPPCGMQRGRGAAWVELLGREGVRSALALEVTM